MSCCRSLFIFLGLVTFFNPSLWASPEETLRVARSLTEQDEYFALQFYTVEARDQTYQQHFVHLRVDRKTNRIIGFQRQVTMIRKDGIRQTWEVQTKNYQRDPFGDEWDEKLRVYEKAYRKWENRKPKVRNPLLPTSEIEDLKPVHPNNDPLLFEEGLRGAKSAESKTPKEVYEQLTQVESEYDQTHNRSILEALLIDHLVVAELTYRLGDFQNQMESAKTDEEAKDLFEDFLATRNELKPFVTEEYLQKNGFTSLHSAEDAVALRTSTDANELADDFRD